MRRLMSQKVSESRRGISPIESQNLLVTGSYEPRIYDQTLFKGDERVCRSHMLHVLVVCRVCVCVCVSECVSESVSECE